MDIRDYYRVVTKHWLAIILLTALGGALALGYSLTATKVYTATAQNFVAVGGMSESGVSTESTFALQRVKSYAELVGTPEVLEPVIQELRLNTTPQALAGALTATNPPQTVLLTVTATNTNPQLAADIANATAGSFAKQIENLETPKGAKQSPVKVSVTTPAAAPTAPTSPRTNINVALGLILGLGLGLAWAFLREQFDNSVKTIDDLREETSAAPLGAVPFDGDLKKNPLIALDQQSRLSESFRTIRTNLTYVDVDNPPTAIAITSAAAAEGKTTTALNLAIKLAQAGHSVCLVEADLRRPGISQQLGIESSVGLTSVLRGDATLENTLLPWNRYLLTVLPSGAIPPNPSELLASNHMRNVIERLKAQFDIVIIDAAPLLPVADGAIVSSACDGAILIAKQGKTSKDQTRRAAEALQRVDARLLGVVLNFVPTKRKHGGYYQYGYYQAQPKKSEKRKRGDQAKSDDSSNVVV